MLQLPFVDLAKWHYRSACWRLIVNEATDVRFPCHLQPYVSAIYRRCIAVRFVGCCGWISIRMDSAPGIGQCRLRDDARHRYWPWNLRCSRVRERVSCCLKKRHLLYFPRHHSVFHLQTHNTIPNQTTPAPTQHYQSTNMSTVLVQLSFQH
jgi:hypothetical protein